MFCRNCGNVLTETEVVCRGCGFAVGTGSHFCEKCGTETPIYAVVCEVCGSKIERDPMEQQPEQNAAYQYAQQPNFAQQTAYAQQPQYQQQPMYQQSTASPNPNTNAMTYQSQQFRVPVSIQQRTSPKSKGVATLLGFTLGALGIHDFYLGDKVKGLIHLGLTITGGLSGISWIWAIVETIQLLNAPNATDGDGQKLR